MLQWCGEQRAAERGRGTHQHALHELPARKCAILAHQRGPAAAACPSAFVRALEMQNPRYSHGPGPESECPHEAAVIVMRN